MPAGKERYRLGIDIGGTFTDLVLIDTATGELRTEKTPSTPANFWEGIEASLARSGASLEQVVMFVHGTTVGLNAFLQRRGTETGLITTRGFRDVYEIGRHNRVEMYDLFYQKPEPLVPRELRLEVTERMDARGQVVTPLDEAEVRQVARALKAQGVESIALCFLHSYANPAHEERAAAILAQEFPQAAVSVSSRIVREWREYERTSTTAINAFIMPVVGRYLSMLQEHLAERRYRHPLFVNQSSGGIIPADTARHQPVRTIMSGPAGGAVCTAYIGQAAGFPDVIGFDMGGTSTDVSLTHAGRTRVTVEAKIEGHPILVPMIDIHSIGAGGGSLARVDAVGTLLVGPQSAGADPGPVCYGRGGTQPTVTDANLVLGRIDPTYFLGGAMALDEASAKRALEEQVAKPLGLPLVQAAEGMIRVVNTKMAYAIRALTVQKGLDPKDFVLLAFGGAGPMHACALAAELDIPRVLVPIVPGAFSALGMLLTDFRHDFARTCLAPASQVDLSQVHSLYEDMVQEATAALLADGVARSAISTERALDMRYTGQEYTVTVLVPNGKFSQRTLAVVRQAFDSAHQRTYGHSSPEQPVEIVSLRLWGRGAVPPLTLPTLPEGKRTPPPEAVRHQGQVYFAEAGGFVTCSFYERGKLLAGNRLEGPAIITDRGATTVLPPGFSLKVSEHGNMLLERR